MRQQEAVEVGLTLGDALRFAHVTWRHPSVPLKSLVRAPAAQLRSSARALALGIGQAELYLHLGRVASTSQHKEKE